MIRERTSRSGFGGAAALLLLASVLAGCGTAPPELVDDPAVSPPKISVVHVAGHFVPKKAPRLLKATIQMHRLRAPAAQRNAPAIIPRRRESPDVTRLDVPAAIPAAAAAVPPAEFEWPVEGKVLLAFGPRSKGERNDGINIEAEPGTPIHAAAAGEVTYAGKLKGYGRLVLIRHDNGYVTAYAHAQAIIVAVGDRVDRGEVIGLSGKSGDIDRPQLHFEIRQGIKPLDPRPLLLSSRES
ncbi:MAG TPA: M23 family metallopeptidase [Rhizomicrobium sp.]|nr:M23 family metallopeptidase [Rhizomicrobium sp.]